jgi:hypothetical protein
MRHRTKRYSMILIALLATLAWSCGQKDKEPEPAQTAAEKTPTAKSTSAGRAGQAPQKTAPVKTLKPDQNPFQNIIKSAGFESVAYRSFPFTRVGDGGEMVVYRTADADKGGVIFLKRIGGQAAPSWHWYFDDVAPDNVQPVEINEDGLWDVQVTMAGGQVREFLQGQTFTLGGNLRNDWIALNGSCSPPIGPGHEMWRCFDHDPGTSWQSSLAGRDEVYIEVNTPFGLQRGILTVHTLEEGRPNNCRLLFDGQEVQSFKLKNETAKQRIQIKSPAQNIKTARLVVLSIHGKGQVVSIAEFSLE